MLASHCCLRQDCPLATVGRLGRSPEGGGEKPIAPIHGDTIPIGQEAQKLALFSTVACTPH